VPGNSDKKMPCNLNRLRAESVALVMTNPLKVKGKGKVIPVLLLKRAPRREGVLLE
jgi:hypothetical protein